jgi:hypothetical protein
MNACSIEADGAQFLETTEKGIDALLVDAFDRTGFAPAWPTANSSRTHSPNWPATVCWSSTWPAKKKPTPA